VAVEPVVVGAGWKNWVFVRVLTDEGIEGLGEATLNGFAHTIEAAVNELKHLVIGRDPRSITELTRRLILRVANDGGQVHRAAVAGIEVALWDILGKSLGVPIWQLLGGRVRESVLGYANGWYRTERTPEGFAAAAAGVVDRGFQALKVDPFGITSGFPDKAEVDLSYNIIEAIRRTYPQLRILIDVHARFTTAAAIQIAERFAPLDIMWWEEPTTREREAPANEVGARSPIPVASGETLHQPGQFYTLVTGGGIDILQPEPMSLGGIGQTLSVIGLATAAGAWVAPHQSGGPVATAVCLQFAACVENFLIQEHFDPFNEPWTSDLVSWRPTIDHATGHLSLPEGPGLGIELNLEVAAEHPYDPRAYLDIYEEGWEQRLGDRELFPSAADR
jgi:galactonate dehydratase